MTPRWRPPGPTPRHRRKRLNWASCGRNTNWPPSCERQPARPCPCPPTGRTSARTALTSRRCLRTARRPNRPGSPTVSCRSNGARSISKPRPCKRPRTLWRPRRMIIEAGAVPPPWSRCSRELLRQQRALMGGVCAYNRNIADYKFSVVGPAATPQELVGGLIITADTPPAARPPSRRCAGRAAGQRRRAAPSGDVPPATGRTSPTLAPPRDESGSAGSGPRVPPAEPVPPDRVPLAKPVPPDAAPSDRLQPVAAASPTSRRPCARRREPADIPETRMVPVERGRRPPIRFRNPPRHRPPRVCHWLSQCPPGQPVLPWTTRKLQGLDPLSPDDSGRGGALSAPAPVRPTPASAGARTRPARATAPWLPPRRPHAPSS